jgi:hypothetical protein
MNFFGLLLGLFFGYMAFSACTIYVLEQRLSLSNLLARGAVAMLALILSSALFMSGKPVAIPLDQVAGDYPATMAGGKAKAAFFNALKGSFQAQNPHTEVQDMQTDTKPDPNELRRLYLDFQHQLKLIGRDNCPTKAIVVKSHWANMEAIDRKFIVFDVEKCRGLP